MKSADTLRKMQYDAGMAEANEFWMQMLDAYPDKTAAEIRRMVERGELPPAPGSRN